MASPARALLAWGGRATGDTSGRQSVMGYEEEEILSSSSWAMSLSLWKRLRNPEKCPSERDVEQDVVIY